VLYTDYLLALPDGGPRAAGRHDRRHRADAAHRARRQDAGHRAQVGRKRSDGVELKDIRRGRGSANGNRSRPLSVRRRALFTIGVFGIFLNRKNVIVILMSIELILLAVNINLVAFSAFLGDLTGPGFRDVGADGRGRRSGIGLAILVVYFRNRGTIAVEDVNVMKG
jgi:NADH-quinone oxidoreductase subunit K